jgi:PPP family 3-phenylpropionic acid transporter
MNNIRLLTLISALCFVAVGITSPLIGLYLQALGADYQEISWILSTVIIISFFSNYFWGWLSDRLGRRKPLLIGGLLILAAAFFLLSNAADERWAWAARILEGVGSAAYATLSLALMGDLLDKAQNRGRQMGWYRGLASAAFAIGAIVGGRLADLSSIPQTLQLCGVLYLVAALCALALTEQPIHKEPLVVAATPAGAVVAPHTVRGSGWTRGLPLLFLSGVILWVGAHSASASMWPNYMDTLGYSKSTIGLFWGFAAFIEFPAMRITGGLSDTVGRAPLLAAGGLGITLVNLGYLFLAQFWVLLVGVQVVRGFGFGSYTTNAMTFAAETGRPEERGSRSGLFNSAASVGSLLGTLISGNIVQFFGFGPLYATCATLALLSALCFWLLRRRQNAQPEPTPQRVGG